MDFVFYLINSIGLFSAIATLLSLAAPLYWRFTFLEHPRPQYTLALLIVVLFKLIRIGQANAGPVQLWPISWQANSGSTQLWQAELYLWLIPLAFNVILLAPYVLPSPRLLLTNLQLTKLQLTRLQPTELQPSSTPPLRLLHTTLDHLKPESAAKTLDWIDRQQVDLVFILEFPPGTLDALQHLQNYQLITANTTSLHPNYTPPTNHYQALLIAKSVTPTLQVYSTAVLHLPPESYRPLLSADILVQGRPLTILHFHSIRPRKGDSLAFQQVEFEAVAQWCQQRLASREGAAIAVIGDWNSTPWSLRYRQFLRRSGLVDSLGGRGLQASWNAEWPRFLRIPIDHGWHSSNLEVRDRQLGPWLGSDHLPLRLDLAWKRP